MMTRIVTTVNSAQAAAAAIAMIARAESTRGNAKRRTCDLRGIPGEGKEVSEQLGDTDEE